MNEDRRMELEREAHESQRDRDRLGALVGEASQALVNVDPAEWEVAARVFKLVVAASFFGAADQSWAVLVEAMSLVRGKSQETRNERISAALDGLPLVAEYEWEIGESDE